MLFSQHLVLKKWSGLLFAVLFLSMLVYSPFLNAEESKQAKPQKIKPFKVETKDGLASLTFGVGAEMQYDSTWANISEANGGTTAQSHKFYFKRIQANIKGHLFTKKLAYKFQVEAIPGKITLMDLFLDYKAHRHARFRFGAHKPGFSRKRMNSWKNQQLVDFSNAPRYYGTERSLGLTLHNGFGKKTTHEYEIGIYGGVPWRSNCTKGITIITKEKMLEPGLMSGKADPYNEIHPEVIGHYAFNFNGIDVSTETDWKRSNFRFSLGAGFAYDFRPKAFRDPAARTAFELMIKAYGFNFFTTFFTAFHDKKAGLSTDFDLAFVGGVAQIGYLFPVPLELAVRYFGNMTTANFRNITKANAAAAIAIDPTDQNVVSQYKGAGDQKTEHEIVFGVNYYPFGRHVKLGTDVSYIMKDYVSKDTQSDVRLRLVLQFFI